MASAKKNDQIKPQWSMLLSWSMGYLEEIVKVLELGAKKYGNLNWQEGGEGFEDRLLSAAMRHIHAYVDALNGTREDSTDSESGIHHLAHAIVNLLFLRWYDELYRGGGRK